MKLLILAAVFTASMGAYADKLDSYGILRNDDGSIRRMQQPSAMQACPQATHLSTVRDLAELSQMFGAKGILEVDQVDPNGIPAGYYKLSAIYPNGKKDEFYFNKEGYQPPNEDFDKNAFWSSSLVSGYNYTGFLLSGKTGDFFAYLTGAYYAVYCAADK